MKAIYLVSIHPDGSETRVVANTHFETAQQHVLAMLATREYRPTMHGDIHLSVIRQGGGSMIYRVRPGSQSDSEAVLNGEAY